METSEHSILSVFLTGLNVLGGPSDLAGQSFNEPLVVTKPGDLPIFFEVVFTFIWRAISR
jgi:hypothetical protein